jgi:hypothetical protein
MVDSTSAVVEASERAPGAEFGPLEPLSSPAFLSTAFPPAAAVDSSGRSFVTWTANATPGTANGGGSSVIASNGPGPFSGVAPQVLSDAPTPPGLQAPAVAARSDHAVVAWVDAGGGHLARLDG